METKRAYLALGSNMGDRYYYLRQALAALNKLKHVTIRKMSSIYETDPVGYENQNCFLNMVIEVETTYDPFELLEQMQKIEKRLGRKRDIRFGPRTIDLDILLYDDIIVKTENLEIPHPRMVDRGFVLIPLCELNPAMIIPKQSKTLQQLINPLSDKEGVRLWKPKNGDGEYELFAN